MIRRRRGLWKVLGKYSPSLEIHELTEPAQCPGESVTPPTWTGLVWSHCPGIIISFTINTAPVRTAGYVVTSANVLILRKRKPINREKATHHSSHPHPDPGALVKPCRNYGSHASPPSPSTCTLAPHPGPISVWDSRSQKCPLCLRKSPEPQISYVHASGNICQ